MKKVFKNGKILAILTLGLAFVFAGCMGQVSEDNGMSMSDALGAYQFTVDLQNFDLDIESASGMGTVAIIDGHTVEIKNAQNCTWDNGTSTLECDITIINHDVEDAMWDVRTRLHDSENAAANVDHADYAWPGPLIIAPDCAELQSIGCGATNPINESGFCFTETGKFPPILGSPYVDEGCPNYVRRANYSPYQYIHAGCGSITTRHQWTNVPAGNPNYRFWVDVSATWIPEDPTGGADPRFAGDLVGHGFAGLDGAEDYRTMYIEIMDLELAAGIDPTYGPAYWEIGSHNISNKLTNPTLANGSYFAVEVGIEYPDRIENHGALGDLGGDQAYEYYNNMAFAVIWDDAVIQKVGADMTTPGGTPVKTGVVNSCLAYQWGAKAWQVYDNCAANYEGYPNQGATGVVGTYSDYLSTTQLTMPFQTAGTYAVGYYYWPANGPGMYQGVSYAKISANAPMGNMGVKGLVSLKSGALVQDGADPDVDFWIGLMYFSVVGASGQGSFMALNQTPYSNMTMAYTNGALLTASDHYAHCFDTVADSYVFGNCVSLSQSTPVSGGGELSNGNLPGGYSIVYTNGIGGYQTRDNHVCVQ